LKSQKETESEGGEDGGWKEKVETRERVLREKGEQLTRPPSPLALIDNEKPSPPT